MRTAEWVGGARRSGATWTAADDTRPVSVLRVTDRFLTELGVRVLAGRDFAGSEQTAAVASRAFAEKHFGSAESAIGRALTLDDGPAEIVGVLADTVEIPTSPDLFRPYALSPTEIAARGSNAVLIVVRLRPGVTLQEADTEAKLIQKRLAETYPRERDNDVRLTPLRPEIVGGVEGPLRALFAAVVAVLAIALASVVSLLLARAAARAGEVAVRMSLGAARARLSRLWLVEALALALPGGLAGLALAYVLVRLYRSAVPTGSGRLNAIEIDGAAALAAAGLMVVAAAVFSLAPRLLGLGRADCAGVKDASRSVAGLRRARWQSGLIAGQVGLSLVLVCCAVWLAASMARLQATPLGFDPEGVLTAQFSVTRTMRMTRGATDGFVERVLERTRAHGAVEEAAVSSSLGGASTSRFRMTRVRQGAAAFGPADDASVVTFVVSPSFFDVMRIRAAEGRLFDDRDRAAPAGVVIVSRSFAQRYLQDGRGTIGSQVVMLGPNPLEVIGIVPDVHADALGRNPDPQVYFMQGSPAPGIPSALSLRLKPGAALSAQELKGIFRQIDPGVLVTIRPLTETIGLALESRALATRAAYAFAAIALLLAAINVYGLASLTVVQRRREIGIRMALGAAAREAVTLVVGRGATWIGAGVLAGLAAAVLVAAPAIRSQLFQTGTGEPMLIAAAALIVCAVALTALWIPARRAAVVDPAITLRAE
jgi:putative ABC transport system permease protein